MNNSYLNIYEKIKKYCDYSYESKMFCVNKRKLLNHFFCNGNESERAAMEKYVINTT